MEQTKINYEEEFSNLKEREETWKPNDGKYMVKFLAEPVDTSFTRETGETIPQWLLKIEILGKKMNWYITKSTRPTSVRGQLVKFGKMKGKLTGESTVIIVQGSGKEKRYTLPDTI